MRKTLFGLSVLAFVGASIPAVRGAEGRTPIFEPGTAIVTEGTWNVVTRNLTGSGQPVITIAADNVVLDLNGFVLSSQFDGPVISVTAGFFQQHVTIRNGVLRHGRSGIEALGVTQQLTIEDVRIHDTLEHGIHLYNVESAALRRVEIRNAGLDCFLWDGTQDKHGTVEDTLVRVCSGGGIVIRQVCESVGVTGNHIQQAAGHGIELSQCRGSLVAGNTVSLVSGSGVRLSESWGNGVTGNTISDVHGNGIHLDVNSASNLVQANTCTRSGALTDWGLRVDGSFNKIEGNVVSENFGGLLFTATACGNTFGRNLARGNQHLPSACTGTPALFPPDSCNMAASCPTPNTSLGDNLIPGPPLF